MEALSWARQAVPASKMISKFPSSRTVRTPMDHLSTHLTLVKSDSGISSSNRTPKLLQRQCVNTPIPSLWTRRGAMRTSLSLPRDFELSKCSTSQRKPAGLSPMHTVWRCGEVPRLMLRCISCTKTPGSAWYVAQL